MAELFDGFVAEFFGDADGHGKAADGVERGGNHAAMQAAVQVMADQFRAHGEFELWRLRVERGHLEAKHFVEAQLVFENVAQHGVETGLLLGGAAGQGGTLNHGVRFLAQKKGRRG